MRIALIGYGGVGRAFEQLLEHKRDHLAAMGLLPELKYIIDQENSGDFDLLLKNRDVDLLVLATPTNKENGEPGLSYIKAALNNGMHVVTADKGPVLLAYHQLKQIAAQNGVHLGIGCTTGGALPAVNGGLVELAGADILSIEGVLNGTSNFILDEMRQKNIGYAQALQETQRLGIAEADPSLDVEGFDTATKLVILTNVLMRQNKTLAEVQRCGITGITAADIAQAALQGKKYKLVGRAKYHNGELVLTVGPERLGAAHPFYMVDGKNKAVRYESDTLGDLTIMGGASGATPAAAALLRDIINIHRG